MFTLWGSLLVYGNKTIWAILVIKNSMMLFQNHNLEELDWNLYTLQPNQEQVTIPKILIPPFKQSPKNLYHPLIKAKILIPPFK